MIGADMSQDSMIREILNTQDSIGHITANRSHTPLIAHYYRIPDSNIIAVQETPLLSFLSEKSEILRFSATLIVISAALVLCLTMYLHRILTRPINTISSYIKNVSKGDFTGSLTLKNNDEFQTIADSINKMEREIRELMEAQKQESEIKKELWHKIMFIE